MLASLLFVGAAVAIATGHRTGAAETVCPDADATVNASER